MSRFSVETTFTALDGWTAPVRKMEAAAQRLERAVRSPMDKVSGAFGKIDGGIRRVAGSLAVAGGVGALAFGKMIGRGAEFEATMVAAAAKFNTEFRKGTPMFEQLEKAAQDVGATTEFSASQSAQALKDLASAGFGAHQAIAALPKVVDLATAAEIDLTTASQVAGESLGAFNLKTEDAIQLGYNLERVNDNLARTADKTSAGIEDLFEAIKEGAPVATTAGAQIETFMALAGKLADSGIKGSVAGTTLKNVFLALSAPTKEAGGVLGKLGIQTRTANGDMIDAVKILGQLQEKTAGMGTAERASTIEAIFGKIPIAGVSALLSGGIDKVEELRQSLKGAGGAATTMANVMRDKVKNDLDGLSSAVENVGIAIFGVSKAPFSKIVKGMTDWVTANTWFIRNRVNDALSWLIANFPLIVLWLKRIALGVTAFYALSAAIAITETALTAFGMAVGVASFVGSAFLVITNLLSLSYLRQTALLAVVSAATWLDNAATTAATVARGAYNLMTSIGTLAVGLLITALTASTYTQGANTAVTTVATAARAAWNAITTVGTIIQTAFTTGTVVSTAAMYAMSAAIWIVQAAQAALNAIFLANPMFLIGVAVVALIAYLLKLAGVWDLVGGAMKRLWGMATSFFSPIVVKAKELFGWVKKAADAFDSLGGGGGDDKPGSPLDTRHVNREATWRPPRGETGGAVPPSEGVSKAITETHSRQSVDVNLNTPPGMTATVSKQPKGGSVTVTPSGGF